MLYEALGTVLCAEADVTGRLSALQMMPVLCAPHTAHIGRYISRFSTLRREESSWVSVRRCLPKCEHPALGQDRCSSEAWKIRPIRRRTSGCRSESRCVPGPGRRAGFTSAPNQRVDGPKDGLNGRCCRHTSCQGASSHKPCARLMRRRHVSIPRKRLLLYRSFSAAEMACCCLLACLLC